MQKRLVRKRRLERAIAEIMPHPNPKAYLEQYTVSPNVAATMLYIATYTYDDIIDKTVLDLGCGTGRLALGAAFLGARQVVGVDIDETAVRVAFENSVKTGLRDKVQWVVADRDAIHGNFDTVLQNPPFGVQRRKADRKFLKKALEIGKSIYSLHKSSHKDKGLIKKLKASGIKIVPVFPSQFLKRFVMEYGGEIKAVYATLMTIPHMFRFHMKRKHEFIVDLYAIRKR